MSKEAELIAAARRLVDIMPDVALPKVLALLVDEWNNRMYGMDALLTEALVAVEDDNAKEEFRASLEEWK